MYLLSVKNNTIYLSEPCNDNTILSEDPRTKGVPLAQFANDQVMRAQGHQAFSCVCVCLAEKAITRDWWRASHARLSFLYAKRKSPWDHP
jgi:hypothetical protein